MGIKRLIELGKYVLMMIALFSVCRILFFLFNFDAFSPAPFYAFVYGLRFDLAATTYLLSPFIIFYLFPIKLFGKSATPIVLKTLFITAAVLAVFFNGIDFFYFKFTAKRSSADLFSLFLETGDAFRLIPQFFKDYWYSLGILAGLIVVINFFYEKIKVSDSYFKKSFLIRFSTLIFGMVISVIAMRGGLQLKPISNLDAANGVKPKYVSLVLNTPFSILRTMSQKAIKEKNYFEDPTIYFNPQLKFSSSQPMTNKNVVIIILESFAKEYVGGLNSYKGYTPNLDSIISQSHTFVNGFANGRKSVDALPSIISGVPAFMEDPYIFSSYSGNHVNSLAQILKPKGYKSAYFHGGANGTMRFNSFCQQAGIDYYYGLDEYPNQDKDFDGNWGIFDEPYLQYSIEMMDTIQKPFVSTIFTLSSHHPYTIPESHTNQFPKGDLEIHESIGYTDYSLGQFFKSIQNKEWYKNTLFIITADHTAQNKEKAYSNYLGSYRVPIVVFEPSKSQPKVDSSIVQQIDIQNMVLDRLNYSGEIKSFGQNPFDTISSYKAFQFSNHLYQYINDDYFYHFDGEKLIDVYEKTGEEYLKIKNQQVDSFYDDKGLLELKALIQEYNSALIHNTLVD